MRDTEPCPSCGTSTSIVKSWAIQRGRGEVKSNWRIGLYKCPKCGRSFRKAEPEQNST